MVTSILLQSLTLEWDIFFHLYALSFELNSFFDWRFRNLLTNDDVTNFAAFTNISKVGEPLSVPFYTSLNAKIPGTGIDIKSVLSSYFSL